MAPEQTVTIGFVASAVRSAETSELRPSPRCTPPMPPVAKTLIPVRSTMWSVAATVVAPHSPRDTTIPRLCRLTFSTSSRVASSSSSASASPIVGRPATIAIV